MQTSVGSRQSAQTTFAAFKDTQSNSFSKTATDAATDVTAAPTTTAVVKPVRPARPVKPPKPQNLLALDKHRVRKGNGGVVDNEEEKEEEEEPEELPSWTRPQRMDSGTFQKGGVDPGVVLVPHHLSGVFEEEDGEKDAEDEAGDSTNVPLTSFRATGGAVRAGRADSGTMQRKVTKRRQTPPRYVVGIDELSFDEIGEEEPKE